MYLFKCCWYSSQKKPKKTKIDLEERLRKKATNKTKINFFLGPKERLLVFGEELLSFKPYYCNMLTQAIFFSYAGKVSFAMVKKLRKKRRNEKEKKEKEKNRSFVLFSLFVSFYFLIFFLFLGFRYFKYP